MEKILNMLYCGEIHPEEDYRPMMPELIEAKEEFAEYRDSLFAEFDEQTREKVQDLLDRRVFVSSYEIEDAYVQGMKMGAKMLAALLEGKKDK